MGWYINRGDKWNRIDYLEIKPSTRHRSLIYNKITVVNVIS